jgi:hypothetical protein
MYANGYAVIPQFKDRTDPFVISQYQAMPDKGAAWQRPNQVPWKDLPAEAPHPLDRATQARRAQGFTAYLCQVGKLAWSAEYDYYDANPYITLMEFEPGGDMPAHMHNGWSGIGVIDGSIEINGVHSTEGAFVLFEPLAKQRLKGGPKGSTIIVYFDSGRAAFPQWENPEDATATELSRVLRIPT